MKKKIIIIATFIFLIFALVVTYGRNTGQETAVNIDASKVNLYFFYGQGCPHCAKEEKFLDQLEADYSEISIHRFETWYNDNNATLLDTIRRDIGFQSGVPVLLVGEEAIVGYSDDETTGQRIRLLVDQYVKNGCNDTVAKYFGAQPSDTANCIHGCDTGDEACIHDCGCSADINTASNNDNRLPEAVNIPFIGSISGHDVALPVFTVLVAAADGFNPCAMWVLLFLINLLIGINDRLKMWILGSAFIIASAAVYFLFVFTWLQVFLFVGLVIWVRVAIATIAFGSGTFHLKEYWDNRDGCKVTANEKRREMFDKLRRIVAEKRFLLALGGVIILAAAVNLVELVCSAGFPQAFVGVLAMANLAPWQRYAYIFLYIFIFMLDDMVVFVIAMSTLKIKAISDKYTHWSYLIGGALMVIIGFLLILKPGWLTFG